MTLVDAGASDLPTMLQYRTHAKERSLYNTPPTFGIYMMGLVFKWIRSEGGLAGMAERNEEKAKRALRPPRPERLLPRLGASRAAVRS